MKRSQCYIFGFVGLACAVLAAMAVRLAVRETEISTLRANASAVLDRNHRLLAAIRTRQQAGTAKHAVRSDAAVGADRSAPPPVDVTNQHRGYQINKLLRDMPEYAPILRRETRRTTMEQYGALFDQISLAPDNLERVKQILDERWISLQDASLAANERGIPNSDPGYQRMLDELIQKADRQLRDVLTPADYDLYSRYTRIRTWQSRQLPELEDYFAVSGVPNLAAAQKQSLGETFLALQKWKPDGPAVPQGMLFRLRNDQFAAKAGAALDPQQQAALTAYMKFVNAREDTLARLMHPEDPDRYIATITTRR